MSTEEREAYNSLTFGELLKKLRLEKAQVGLRVFAGLIEMAPSNLSDIERNRKAPPASRKKIDQICQALGLPRDSEYREQLFDLSARAKGRIPADVAEAIKEEPAIPILVRTVANRQLGRKKLEELTEYIKRYY